MFKIGDFSRLSQVSVKTLRLYDEMQLVKPTRVDPVTGYRYYSVDQLSRVHRILALKDLGFTLEQISHVLQEPVSEAELRGMLRLKRAQVALRIREEQERLARVEARLAQTERPGTGYEVVLKQVKPQLVAAVRRVVPDYFGVTLLLDELLGYTTGFGGHGPAASIWHDEGYKEDAVDAEAVVYLPAPIPQGDSVSVYELPGTAMATVVHAGSYAQLYRAYDALAHWIAASGYAIAGPSREVYLHWRLPVRMDDDANVTEVQFPVAKGAGT